ncbi:CASC3/Barentsz eIF4AIII binding [Abeliophyllum distichum]|uniref:CASC3/Barentsz eIF4AIII binding n=1 Tax=Abeliophyllum distichum TaxID=126358 RepID=A0ABD1VC20_9LAMI
MSGKEMADEEEVEVEYESDPEEAKLSLKMRRREASDDEEEGEEEGERRENAVRPIESDGESEGQGAAAEYGEGEEEYEGEEYVQEEEEEYEGSGGVEVAVVAVEKIEEVNGGVEGELNEEKRGMRNDVNEKNDDSHMDDGQQEQKKEIEPYAVPMAGAFYMHDDRFRDNAGGRHRRTLGGRKLWESKDERKWGHDKFEELTTQEWHYEERRKTSRGRYRGRGRNRGSDRGYARENRPKVYNNNNNNQNSDNHQNNAVKGVRGRGPRRYQPSFKNYNEAPLTQNKQSVKSVEKPSRVNSGRTSAPMPSVESDAFPPRKQMFASNLSIASPPFYPSGSSTKDTTLPLKRDVQVGTTNRNVQPSIADKSFTLAQSSAMVRGKNIVDSIGMDTLYIDDSLSAVAEKPLNALQKLPSGPSSFNSTQPQQLRVQGRGTTSLTQMAYKPVSNNQVNRVPPATLLQTAQKNPGQSRGLSSPQASGQQFVQRPTSGSQASSPPKAVVPANSFETEELESLSDSSKSKTALDAKGKGSVKGGGRGSFLYGGVQVMGASGNMGSGHGDQNFPAFLPVMQFGRQHPGGGIGVPAVGMAFPGYVAQPQLGLGNSEMTWLPVLAGAAGTLGTTYSPYLSADGSYHARSSGQTSSAVATSSKETNTTKDNNEWNPMQRPEVANDDFGQRQKNPRRYTEMKFDHLLALCVLLFLIWSALGCRIFWDNLGICDKRLIMLLNLKNTAA